IPNSLQALMTRTAISPRLAMRIFLNRTDGKQSLPVLYRLAVHHGLVFHNAGGFGLNLIHQLHGFDDAKHLSRLDAFADAHEWLRARRTRFVESAYNGGLDQGEVRVRTGRLGGWFMRRRRIGGRYCGRGNGGDWRRREFLRSGETSA